MKPAERTVFLAGPPFDMFLLYAVGAGLGGLCTVLIALRGHHRLAAVAAVTALILTTVVMACRSRLTVARDGVHVQWLLYRRFVRFGDLDAVELRKGTDSLRLVLVGSGLRLSLSERYEGELALAQRALLDGLARFRVEPVGAALDAGLSRGLDDVPTWRGRLEALAPLVDTFRGPSRAWLLERVADPHEAEAVRAAAAIVLRALDAEPAREAIRVAAEATASPKLRVALERSADGSDAALDEALDAVAPVRPRADTQRPGP